MNLSDGTLKKIQGYTGLTFSGFLINHLVIHISSHYGIQTAITLTEYSRIFYQNPYYEYLGIGASSFLHLCSSFTLMWRRRQREIFIKQQQQNEDNDDNRIEKEKSSDEKQKVDRKDRFNSNWDRDLNRIAGLGIALFFPGHVLATRVIPYLLLPKGVLLDETLVTFTLKETPYLFFPYYTALMFFGFYHLSFAFFRSLPVSGLLPKNIFLIRNKSLWKNMTVVILAISVSTILNIGAVYYQIEVLNIEYIRQIKQQVFGFFNL